MLARDRSISHNVLGIQIMHAIDHALRPKERITSPGRWGRGKGRGKWNLEGQGHWKNSERWRARRAESIWPNNSSNLGGQNKCMHWAPSNLLPSRHPIIPITSPSLFNAQHSKGRYSAVPAIMWIWRERNRNEQWPIPNRYRERVHYIRTSPSTKAETHYIESSPGVNYEYRSIH